MKSNSKFPKKSTVKSPFVAPVKKILRAHNLFSVCESAHCPNIGECFKKKTATFLIMGSVCTRNCRFCNIGETKNPQPLDQNEPQNLAEAVSELSLRYVVVTSVTRDDLPDGGANHFAKVIQAIRNKDKNIKIEVLTPDFKGNKEALKIVADAKPDVFNHNVETVERLYSLARPQANYKQSLEVLKYMKTLGMITKSGIMTGLGETKEEIIKLLEDVVKTGCDIMTIGQYFRPSKEHLPVEKNYLEEEFEELKQIGLNLGFKEVYAGRFVRSSFNASEIYNNVK